MLQDPKTVELKNKYKKKIKDFVQENKPELIAGGIVAGVMMYYAFYAFGKYAGMKEIAHGPCMEITADAAEGLLQGKFMITKVIGDDLFYKIVDVDVDALLP